MNTSHLKHVVNQNEEMYNPLNMDGTSAIIKGIFCSIGIPLNFSLAVTTLRFGRLYQTPHNIFLLAIVLSYLSFFIPPLMELIYWGLYPDESLCHSYVAVVTVPQGLSLVNKALALAEIYLAINHPLLHKRKMTPRLACYLTVFGSILTVFLLKFVNIVQLGNLSCKMWLFHVKMMATILIILLPSCIAMNITVHGQTQNFLCESRTLDATPDDGHLSSSNPISNATPAMSVHAARTQLSHLGMKATRNLVTGVASLCVMPFIVLVFAETFFTCQSIDDQLECSDIIGKRHSMMYISLIPAIYGPIIFFVRNN